MKNILATLQKAFEAFERIDVKGSTVEDAALVKGCLLGLKSYIEPIIEAEEKTQKEEIEKQLKKQEKKTEEDKK